MSNVTSSSLLGNIPRYEDLQQASPKTREEMGKQDFLALFTAQLKNQNPLDPVKNEAFVAQLAQFSQLEALTNMQGSLDTFVTAMSAERLLGGASLIGRKVAVTDSFTRLEKGGAIDATIDLPQGASGVSLVVYDSMGRPVQELVGGARSPGTASLTWDGLDAMENPAPSGFYRLKATAVVNGKTTTVPVNTFNTVRSITTNPTDGSVSLEIDGGKTVRLTDVQRVGQ
jgi:flagellar basal-body rod modification protein FlgD